MLQHGKINRLVDQECWCECIIMQKKLMKLRPYFRTQKSSILESIVKEKQEVKKDINKY